MIAPVRRRREDRDPGIDLEDALDTVRAGLASVAGGLADLDLPILSLRGKLLRPLVAWAVVPPESRRTLDERFWWGALAVQMVHEASLLHDDVLDGAPRRRGSRTMGSGDGVAAAVIQGDRLLTAAYRVASRAGSSEWLERFVVAVERTVAGELRQGRAAGRRLDETTYRGMITGKSGELFGVAATLWGSLHGATDLDGAADVGLRLGAAYQMLDDLLDVCPAADTGKPPFQDYRQGKWTWVMGEAGVASFDLGVDAYRLLLFRPRGRSPAALASAPRRMRGEAREILALHRRIAPDDAVLPAVLAEWISTVERAVAEEVRAVAAAGTPPRGGTGPRGLPSPLPPPALATREAARVAALAARLGGPGDWSRYFARHGRSFRFATHLFPPEAAGRVSGVYAFCRFTDDLVDESEGEDEGVLRARLEAWRALALRAHRGEPTSVPLLDAVLGLAGREGVPFHYVDELIRGVAMDVGPVRIATLDELDVYCYRVASVVGGWITELSGVRDREVLDRAFDLGRAMQLTNILRDVGEDWRRGRLYLPLDRMEAVGVSEAWVAGLAAGAFAPSAAWRDLMEEMAGLADRRYDRALEALGALPPSYRRPVAVAARVYQGIHRELRRAGWQNGTRRAWTSLPRKLTLTLKAVGDLRRAQEAPWT